MSRQLAIRSAATSVALGAGSVVIGALGSGYGALSLERDSGVLWLRYVSGFLGAPWAWGLLGLALGYAAGQAVDAMLLATGGLLLAVASYYVAKAAVGITPWLDWNATATWCVAALVTGPVLGLLGHAARRRSWATLPAALVAPALMSADVLRTPGVSGPTHPGAEVVVLMSAVLLAVVLTTRVVRAEQRLAA